MWNTILGMVLHFQQEMLTLLILAKKNDPFYEIFCLKI